MEAGESKPGISPPRPPPKKKTTKKNQKTKPRGSELAGGTCGRAALARASPGGIRRAALVPGFQGHFNPVCWLLERSHRRGCWRGTAGPRRRCQERGGRSRQRGRDTDGALCVCVPRSPHLGRPPSMLPPPSPGFFSLVPGALRPVGDSRAENRGLGPRLTPQHRGYRFLPGAAPRDRGHVPLAAPAVQRWARRAGGRGEE